jgi:hydrogenase maturation protein HypF
MARLDRGAVPATLTGACTTSARIVVSGLVQGVGFRPWVARRASALGLVGWVRNTGDGVAIEVHGHADAVAAFVAAVTDGDDAPGLVVRATMVPASSSVPAGFSIRASDVDAGGAWIGADTGVCARCLDELFDPRNRRFRHPFIHCPRCGPRFTIQSGVPFDRARTSLAAFVECEECVAEGQDPDDRRCHDQGNACRRCGPRLWLETRTGQRLDDGDDGAAIAAAAATLAGGGVLALKGIGGFHLVCRADADDAIARLRAFKQRPTRPLAVMAAHVASASTWVELTPAEQAQLCAPARPIVLARRRATAPSLLPQVAPGQAWLGVMLPYTAVQHLLFWEAAGRPATTTQRPLVEPALWVVTSANRRGEPLIIDDDVARGTLVDVADGWLLHDLAIVARADDSVLRPRRRQPVPAAACAWLCAPTVVVDNARARR